MRKSIFVILILLVGGVCRAQLPSGSWSGAIDVQGVSLTLVFHFSSGSCTLDVPDQGAKGIPAQLSLTPLGAIRVDVAAINASFEGFRFSEKIVGTFSQHGVSFPLTLLPGAPERKRPQAPQPPFPYATESVSFTNGDAVLKGTLTLPDGFSRATPVCVMVTGSGLQDRDETLFEHKPFAVIADYLARRGIATLRYDDRGFGESTGDLVSVTTEDLKNDAAAGITLLRSRFDRVGLIGHSEGGTIALMLAAEQQVDFIVSLAGMVISGRALLLTQNRRALLKAGFSEEVITAYCDVLDATFGALVAGTPLPDIDGIDLPKMLKSNYMNVVGLMQTPYYRYFLALDVRSSLDRISCPVLGLNGTLDSQVDCAENLAALTAGLPVSAKNLIRPLEGLNHLFQHGTTGDVAEYAQIEETFSPDVLRLMAEWISGLVF